MIKFLVCVFLCAIAYSAWLFGSKIRQRSTPPGRRLTLVNGLLSKKNKEVEND